MYIKAGAHGIQKRTSNPLKAGVTGCSEPLNVGAGNRTQSLWESSQFPGAGQLSTPSPTPLSLFFFFHLAYFFVLLSCKNLLHSLDTNHFSKTGEFDKAGKNKLSSGRGWNFKNLCQVTETYLRQTLERQDVELTGLPRDFAAQLHTSSEITVAPRASRSAIGWGRGTGWLTH